MCDLAHNLQLKNVQPGQVFHYSVIFLKAELVNPCRSGKVQIVCNNNQPVQFSIAAENGIGNVEGKQEVHQKLRILLRLFGGEHVYEVQYCNVKTSSHFLYAASDTLFTVVPLYIICKGHSGRYQSHEDDSRNGIDEACRKITLAIELLQCLYAEKLHEHGYGRKTFTLESPCVPFHSGLEWERSTTMTEGELWHQFATELLQSKRYDMERVKVVGFLSSTHFDGISDGDYSYENIRKKTTGHAALGGGGLALFGTGCLYTWPPALEAVCDAFTSQQPVDCGKLLDDSNYRRTYGGCFATTLGSVCHEMGHTFDLGHTPDSSIMGDGFDSIDYAFVGPRVGCRGSVRAPKRLIDTKPHGLAGRLTQLKRPGDVLRQRLEAKHNDGVFFAPISARTLSYHRWFNHHHRAGSNGLPSGSMQFDHGTRTVMCSNGSSIVLAELRTTDNGMMQKCWTFQEGQQASATTFTLPRLPNLPYLTLFAMDADGNILKANLCSISTAQTSGKQAYRVFHAGENPPQTQFNLLTCQKRPTRATMSDESVEPTAPSDVVCEAKILFRQLKPFPVIDENNNYKISTEHFLESSNQIIDAFACFGKLFAPIVRDMRQNVQKITVKYKQNEPLFQYLEDLILKDKDGNANPFDTVTDGLLWLKRAFEMMEQFFRNLLEDDACSEQVKPHLKKAYEECLLPYHGFLAQKAFQLLHLYLPTRSSLLGPPESNADNLKALDEFLVLFRANLNHINEFFTKHDLHRTYKA
uniref:Glycolipid transfer protein domain-containing protein n=2 Tax=Anopheles stephensi TaxID=30069 RepID=A0A182YGF8_ANOST